MFDNGHNNSPLLKLLIEFKDVIYVSLLAMWGATASYIMKMQKHSSLFVLKDLLFAWIISGFSGIITYLFCVWRHYPEELTAAMVGVSGFMGGELILIITRIVRSRANRIIGKE